MSDKFVNIIDNLGEVYSIPERFVGQEIDAGRIKGLATPEQVAKAKRDLKYGTPGQMAITAAEGAAKGLSLGVSPWIEKQLGVNPADIAATGCGGLCSRRSVCWRDGNRRYRPRRSGRSIVSPIPAS